MDKLQRVLDEFSVGKILNQVEISDVEIKNEIFHRYLLETTKGLFLLAETKDSFDYKPAATKVQAARLKEWLINESEHTTTLLKTSAVEARKLREEFLTLLPRKLKLKNAKFYEKKIISGGKESTSSRVHKFDNQYWLFEV